MDQEFWGNASREKRMRQAHKDVTKSGKTKIGFAEFEKRMLGRDQAKKKADFENRKIRMS
jgi:hypothetical protein